MTNAERTLAIGQPDFQDARLNQLTLDVGAAAAWTEFLLRPDADQRLGAMHGDFAYASANENGQGFAIVDRFATRSLCWCVRDGQLQVAGNADELAQAHPEIEIDPQAIFDYLYFHCIPSPRTIYKGIFRLPPAHCLRMVDGQPKVWRYWTPTFKADQKANFPALKDEFLGLLKGAVARTLDAGKPACFLSGGTDSSTVAGMIQQATGQGADSYSIGFEAEGYDEMGYARIAAKRFGARQHEYYVTPQDILDGMAGVAAHYDQPFGNSSALPAYYCARMAQADGVTKILAGDGGDELFGGNARYAKQRVFSWYGKVPGPLKRGLLEPLLRQPWADKVSVLRKGASYVEQAQVGMPGRLQMYNLLLRLDPRAVMTPALLAQVDSGGPLAHQSQAWGEVQGASELNTTLAFDWRYTLGESDLPKVVGTTAMAGIDVGFPLLDSALLDFSLRLPDDYKLRGLKLRWFFKEALRGFLPDEIITKPKHGFGLPFGVWLGRHPGLGRYAAEALRSLAARGVVRSDFVERLLTEWMPQHPGYYGEMVWILSMLELWLQAKRPAFRMN